MYHLKTCGTSEDGDENSIVGIYFLLAVKDRRDGQARSYHDIVGLSGTMVSDSIACKVASGSKTCDQAEWHLISRNCTRGDRDRSAARIERGLKRTHGR